MVFSEGLPWPDATTALQYSSARKYFVAGAAPIWLRAMSPEPPCSLRASSPTLGYQDTPCLAWPSPLTSFALLSVPR